MLQFLVTLAAVNMKNTSKPLHIRQDFDIFMELNGLVA